MYIVNSMRNIVYVQNAVNCPWKTIIEVGRTCRHSILHVHTESRWTKIRMMYDVRGSMRLLAPRLPLCQDWPTLRQWVDAWKWWDQISESIGSIDVSGERLNYHIHACYEYNCTSTLRKKVFHVYISIIKNTRNTDTTRTLWEIVESTGSFSTSFYDVSRLLWNYIELFFKHQSICRYFVNFQIDWRLFWFHLYSSRVGLNRYYQGSWVQQVKFKVYSPSIVDWNLARHIKPKCTDEKNYQKSRKKKGNEPLSD